MTNIETKQCKKVGVGGLNCPCCRPKNTRSKRNAKRYVNRYGRRRNKLADRQMDLVCLGMFF